MKVIEIYTNFKLGVSRLHQRVLTPRNETTTRTPSRLRSSSSKGRNALRKEIKIYVFPNGINRFPQSSASHSETRREKDDDKSKQQMDVNILSYEQIPGPKPLPIFGNLFFFSKFGKCPLEDYWSMCQRLFNTYGHIVRISRASPKLDIVYLFRPEDLQKLFQDEGPLPYRPKLDILSYYRQQRSNLFSSGGLVSENGEEWKRFRKAIPALLNRKVVASYQEKQAAITDELVQAIEILQRKKNDYEKTYKEESHIEDLLPLLFRYTLEAVGVASLGMQLGCLRWNNLPINNTSDSQTARIISANEDTLESIFKSLFFPPFYRLFPTRNYLKLLKAQDFLTSVMQKELTRLQEEFTTNPSSFSRRNPLIASLLQNKALFPKDTLLLLMEILQGGIDATATTLAFCIYFLASDDGIQQLLHEEVAKVDSRNHNLQGLPILKAVLRETFRLRPSATAVGRVLQKDSIFSGFQVPAGTLIQGPPLIACRNSKTFSEPNDFNPLRWIKEEKVEEKNEPASFHSLSNIEDCTSGNSSSSERQVDGNKIHPYAILPFGHGARMCPGRRLAEQEIYLALIKLVQTYKMKLVDSDNEVGKVSAVTEEKNYDRYLRQVMRLNMMPAKKISLRFIKRQII